MKKHKYCKDGTLSEYALCAGYTQVYKGHTLDVKHGIFFAIPEAHWDATQPHFTARTKKELLKKLKVSVKYEITDLFGGEANHSWVKRGEVFLDRDASEKATVRAVKKAIGWQGTRCRKENIGETIALYPTGSCTVCFIS